MDLQLTGLLFPSRPVLVAANSEWATAQPNVKAAVMGSGL